MKRKEQQLPNHREAVLLSCLINGEKYGRELRTEYEERCGRAIPLGSLYTTLDRMEDKGFLKSRFGESVHERGGNRRKYYRITGHGAAALDAYELWAASVAGVLKHVVP